MKLEGNVIKHTGINMGKRLASWELSRWVSGYARWEMAIVLDLYHVLVQTLM